MKLISFSTSEDKNKLAILVGEMIYPIFELNPSMPDNMKDFLNAEESAMDMAKMFETKIEKNPENFNGYLLSKTPLLSPVPEATSCRDGYAFRQHVMTARRNRGVEMIPEFDMFPIFYFTNHNAIYGPGVVECMPDHFQRLDFELEAAIVIGKKGKNVRASEADAYIAGYMIMNDLSARVLQMEEMKLSLGPAKGKDFATTLGPFLVTPDELEPFRKATKEGHIGAQYDLNMKCWVNGIQVSEGNLGDMDWTFAEIIERVSYGTEIFPGDVIGSGTVGTGCFLELNGSGLLADKNYKTQWLQDGDTVEMEITGMGRLKNTIQKVGEDYSLIALNKEPQE